MSTNLQTTPTRSFDRLNQFMEDVLTTRLDLMPWHPAVDIKETDKEFTFKMEVPGFTKEDIDIEMANDTLTIRGKRVFSKEEQEEDYIRRERKWGEFRRSFKLDAHVRPDSIQASYKDGVLTIVAPKIEAVAPQKIKISA